MMILRRLLSSFSGILIAIIALLGAAFTASNWQRKRAEAESEIYEEQVRKHKMFLERQKDLEEQTEVHRANVKNQSETGDIELARNPNVLRFKSKNRTDLH